MDSPGKDLLLEDDMLTGDSVRQMALGSNSGIRSSRLCEDVVMGALATVYP